MVRFFSFPSDDKFYKVWYVFFVVREMEGQRINIFLMGNREENRDFITYILLLCKIHNYCLFLGRRDKKLSTFVSFLGKLCVDANPY